MKGFPSKRNVPSPCVKVWIVGCLALIEMAKDIIAKKDSSFFIVL
jgi:hypothetical protein